MVDILDYIDKMQEMYEGKPSSMAQKPRNMYAQGQLVQPNADGSRPGYSGRKIDAERLQFLNESAKKYGYENYESVPTTEQNQPGKRVHGVKEKIQSDATRRQQGKVEGKGSPGVSKTYKTITPLGDPEIIKQISKNKKLKFQAEPMGKRLQWIANNGKNYNNTKDFIKAYEKHFKHKIGSKKDVLFNTPGKKSLTQVDNLMNTGRAQQDLFTLTFKDGKVFNQNELFKASMIQNNPEIKKEFKTLFKDVHKNVSVYSELGPEGIVEKLNKGKLLTEFDFVKSGVGGGITRNSLLNSAGVNSEHLISYQNVRKPIMALSQIIQNLKNPSFAKDFKISPTTATKIRGQLENFFKGERGLQADIKKINNQLGDVKFNNIFGGVNFEHTLAKQFGKDYKYLPRNYLLKGQFTTKAFNMMKKDVFDLPLIKLMKQYEQGKISGAKVQAFIDDFNAKTNNYADFKFDVDKGKLGYTSDSVTYDLSRYDNPNVARQELIDNIKLTQSKTFQTEMGRTLPDSKNELKLFKSKQGKEMLRLLEQLGCGQAGGGRILMSNGGAAMTECAFEGKKRLNKGMSLGFDKTEGELAKKILQAGRGLGSMFALRNILGPAAVGFTVAAEAGLVGYDMLATGKSFKEAVGASLFNYALGDKTKIDNKKLRYQGYKDAGVSANQIGKISAYENAIDEMNNTFAEFDEENRLYNIAANQKGRGRISEQRYKKLKQQQAENFYNQADKNKALIQDLARTQTESRLDKALDPMVPALMSDADAKRKAMQMTKPSTVKFGNVMDTIFPSGFFSDTTYREDRDKAVNYMPEVQEYYRGNRFARGGLSGGDTSGPPPESGPMSQGLRSLYKNGRKL
jgi:hypothetical protein